MAARGGGPAKRADIRRNKRGIFAAAERSEEQSFLSRSLSVMLAASITTLGHLYASRVPKD